MKHRFIALHDDYACDELLFGVITQPKSLEDAESPYHGEQRCIGHLLCVVHVSSGADRGPEPFWGLYPHEPGYTNASGSYFVRYTPLLVHSDALGIFFVRYTHTWIGPGSGGQFPSGLGLRMV